MPEISSPEAEEGTALHKAVETGRVLGLTEEQQDLVHRALSFIGNVMFELLGGSGNIAFEQPISVPGVGDGHADIVLTSDDLMTIVVIENKFGRNPVAAKSAPIQAAYYACGIGHLETKRIGIVYHVRSGTQYRVIITPEDYEETLATLKGVVDRAMEENAPRVPGPEQCQYCRAIGTCPEIHKELSTVIRPDVVDPQAIARALPFCSVAEKAVSEIKRAAKRLLQMDPQAIPGWKLVRRQESREIPDPNKAYVAMGGSLTPQEFVSCVDVSVTKLEKAWTEKRAVGTTQKEAKASFNAVMANVIQRGHEYDMLVRSDET